MCRFQKPAYRPAPLHLRDLRAPVAGPRARLWQAGAMDLPSDPPVSPAVRITVLLRLVSEGFQDAFAARPAWLEAPAVDLAELREIVGVERVEQLRGATGLREGAAYTAGGPAGTVTLAAAAHEGVLGLLGLAALPLRPVGATPGGARYHVPEDWFIAAPAGRNGSG
jgi:hypothetical protein